MKTILEGMEITRSELLEYKKQGFHILSDEPILPFTDNENKLANDYTYYVVGWVDRKRSLAGWLNGTIKVTRDKKIVETNPMDKKIVETNPMDKFFPATVKEFIDERIAFFKTCIEGFKANPNHQNDTACSLFVTGLVDMEFCERIYKYKDRFWMQQFKSHMQKVVMNCYNGILHQEYQLASVHGITFMTNKEVPWLPLEVKAYNEEMKKCLSNIYNEVMEINWPSSW